MDRKHTRSTDEIERLRARVRGAERDGARAVIVSHVILDPVPLAAAAIAETVTLPIVVGMRLERTHPFLAARALTTLDHLSGGRIGLACDLRGVDDAMASDFVDAVDALWQSWEPDAEVQDAATGVFADADRVHAVHVAGRHYRSRGPLNLPHAPQATLPIWGAPRGVLASRIDHPLTEDEADWMCEQDRSVAVLGRSRTEEVA